MLARLVPGPLVRWFARPYVAGDSIESALKVADERLREDGVLTTLDLLGEDVRTPEQVRTNVATYRSLIESLAEDPRFSHAATRPSVSVKPSAFTCGEREDARKPIEELAEIAHEHGVAMTIDMEDRNWTDLTLEMSLALFQRGWDVGTVLQTRLHRTVKDIETIPAGMRLRLVIGIYPEPAEAAVRDKRVMKERLVEYSGRLLDRGVFVEYASHDIEFAERFVQDVAGAAPERCEVQMLLGVPRADFRRRLQAGEMGSRVPLRLYVPFAVGWADATAYLRRRMEESPNVGWLVIRNFFAGRSNR